MQKFRDQNKISEFINELLTKTESEDLEFKHASGGFPGSFWDTYSSFANTEGGTIIFGIEEKNLICGMNEKEGRFVLSEIAQTGNFGQTDSRFSGMSVLRRMTKHGIHLLLHYPSEVIWTPVWLVYHKVWKWNKVRRIKRG